MDRRDWEQVLDAQEPPHGFAEKMVKEAMRAERPKPGRAAWVGAGVIGLVAIAAGIAMTTRTRAKDHGDVTAEARREVKVGSRALAVLEKGARVAWDGESVVQSQGDVFWRVEPGARFVVKTPEADVTVKGTCFRVGVRGQEDAMTRRDAIAGVIGAAVGTATLVGVYEGRVALAHGGQSVDLVAGQEARADARGVYSAEDPAEETTRSDDKALLRANANLAGSVSDYRRRLEALEEQKKALEKKLTEAEAKVGGEPKNPATTLLTADDWREFAKKGTLPLRLPCDPGDMKFDGLPPDDAAAAKAAFDASQKRVWSVLQSACAKALGLDEALAEQLGTDRCIPAVFTQTRGISLKSVFHDVALIRAGDLPVPTLDDPTSGLVRIGATVTGEVGNIEADLASKLGPEDAQLVMQQWDCWSNGQFTAP